MVAGYAPLYYVRELCQQWISGKWIRGKSTGKPCGSLWHLPSHTTRSLGIHDMGDFVPILRRPGPAVKCQRRLDRLFSNFCRTHEWNLGERVDVAQQLNAPKPLLLAYEMVGMEVLIVSRAE